jgi:superfamily I DNA/RNA helicase
MIELHEGQKKALKSPSRYLQVFVGRRWGKTEVAIRKAIQIANGKNPEDVTIYTSDYRKCQMIVRRIRDLLPKEREISFREMKIQIPNGGTITVDIFPIRGNVILDDAFNHVKSLTMFQTPFGWGLIQGPSTNNPVIQKEQAEQLKDELGDQMYRSQILGEFEGVP